ncbi:hypothetical protein IEQ34_011854 [Dendrobium chrysotoxum]|uniref:BTB/POZ domain-containing protein n=1 Tax=Dendrobium chrysotoxum TaxID=161865 RepID=A0AAV7GSG8_DENCH|nr:hypothetical protein IEQ34_011854 [Dendrobium chrysotoxum]
MAGEKGVAGSQAWFCTTGLPSDVVVEVDGMSFHLHKFPLMLKSRKLHELLSEQEHKEEDEEIDEGDIRRISLHDFPGVSATFEAAAKFCYGVRIDVSSTTVAPLRCAAEYLEMTEDFAEDNLVSRTELFLTQSVFRSLSQSVKVLKTCETLLPLAEDLGIAQRCIDNIVTGACATEVSSLFSWPVSDHHKNGIRSATWMEDLTVLNLPFYKRVISAMKERNPSTELIEGSLVSYAKRTIPGLSRSKRNLKTAPPPAEPAQLDLLETIITNLSPAKSSVFISAQFLFGLLRTANILHAPESLRTPLEKRIAAQLEQATLDDLLMPSYSYLVETLYDVEAVERVLRYFIEEASSAITAEDVSENVERLPAGNGDPFLTVGRLVDGFLAEVASDANLRVDKFCDIALALPDHSRVYDDGLYRAVDVFLKAHPALTESEKEKICGVMNFRKLTLEACTHAAQNERLPLRAVVQVLFFEQLQLRQAIAGTILTAEEEDQPTAPPPPPPAEGGRWRVAAHENQLLRLGMDSMRNRVQDLERECSSMRRAIERIDGSREAGRWQRRRRQPPAGGWGSLGRKLGCKSRMQVFDSQEAAPKRSVEEQS